MRPSHVLTLTFVAGAALLAACGGDSNGPSNPAPTAEFTSACTQLACTFTDASSDVAPGTIASWSWTFGDNSTPVTTKDATHTYTQDGTFNVQLTVTDNGGETDSVTHQVTVTSAAPGNQPPVANFTADCTSLDCSFTNSSTDTDGTFTSTWDFGDGSPVSTEANPTHTYTATTLTPYTVTLTVTDDGGLTATKTLEITVAPLATLTCGTTPDCSLQIEAPARVTVLP
jgi:PKD repeat protein